MSARAKKLIEASLPLPEINDASAYDKMPGIGPHPKGIHHWWARLPLPTARAVLFASVVDDPESHPEKWPTEEAQQAERERLFSILRRMMQKKLHDHPDVYAEAYGEMLAHCDGRLPTVFDPFAGGGSIPLEANRLGFAARAADLNPVAVTLNKCNLELAPGWSNQPPVNPTDRSSLRRTDGWKGTSGLAADLRYYADRVAERLNEHIGDLYPKVRLNPTEEVRASVVAWVWVRTVASPNPAAQGRHVPLASSFVLASKGNRTAWVEPILDAASPDGWRFTVQSGSPSKEVVSQARMGTKSARGQDFICTLTHTPIQRSYIQAEGKAGRLRERLMAVVADGPTGRVYLAADAEQERVNATLQENIAISEARATLLSGPLPTRAEITGGVCTAYGLATWGHLFSARQVLALLTLSDEIRAIRRMVESDALTAELPAEDAARYSKGIATLLALGADRCSDFGNSLCRWSPSNEKVMNLFGKQALPMVFDYAEANFLGTSVGSWLTCSNYVADCVRVIDAGKSSPGMAFQADAANEHLSGEGLLISTDPPYYNNISYAVLSDFFYVWLRRTVGDLYPEVFGTLLTPKVPELIAAANRFGGDPAKAKEHFETGFRHAFTSLAARMDQRFPLTVYYAFKQDDEETSSPDGDSTETTIDLTTGWETLLEALNSSGFQITATWPVRASQKWRMVSMGTNALASYIVLACRPRSPHAPQTDRRSFVGQLKAEMPLALKHLQQGNIAPVDLQQAAIGPGMAIYSSFSRILESDGRSMPVRTALSLINQSVTEVLSAQEDEFESETRWAISWFEQHGFEEGDFGDAELLSKAKVTSINALQQAGIVRSKSGKVRLLRPEELTAEEIASNRRLTVWEMTHQTLRIYFYLKAGDEATATFVRSAVQDTDTVRDLAYRLFTICDRNKWAQEALAYNALALGWPEITRLARQNTKAEIQSEMFSER